MNTLLIGGSSHSETLTSLHSGGGQIRLRCGAMILRLPGAVGLLATGFCLWRGCSLAVVFGLAIASFTVLAASGKLARALKLFKSRLERQHVNPRSLDQLAASDPADDRVVNAIDYLKKANRFWAMANVILAATFSCVLILAVAWTTQGVVKLHGDSQVRTPFVGALPQALASYAPRMQQAGDAATVITQLLGTALPAGKKAEESIQRFLEDGRQSMNSLGGANMLGNRQLLNKAIDNLEEQAAKVKDALQGVADSPVPARQRADARSASEQLSKFQEQLEGARLDSKLIRRCQEDLPRLQLRLESFGQDMAAFNHSVISLTDQLALGGRGGEGVSANTSRLLDSAHEKQELGQPLSDRNREVLQQSLQRDFETQPPTFAVEPPGSADNHAAYQQNDSPQVQSLLQAQQGLQDTQAGIKNLADNLLQNQLSGSISSSQAFLFPFHYQGPGTNLCGPVADQMVLHYKQGKPDFKNGDPGLDKLQYILTNVPLLGEFTTPGGLEDGFHMYGYNVDQMTAHRMADICRLIDADRPPILLVRPSEDEYHYVVAIAYRPGEVGLADPGEPDQDKVGPLWCKWSDLAGSMNFERTYQQPARDLNRGFSGFVLRPYRGRMVVVGEPGYKYTIFDRLWDILSWLPRFLLDLLKYLFDLVFGGGVDGGDGDGGQGQLPGTQGGAGGNGGSANQPSPAGAGSGTGGNANQQPQSGPGTNPGGGASGTSQIQSLQQSLQQSPGGSLSSLQPYVQSAQENLSEAAQQLQANNSREATIALDRAREKLAKAEETVRQELLTQKEIERKAEAPSGAEENQVAGHGAKRQQDRAKSKQAPPKPVTRPDDAPIPGVGSGG